MAVINYRDPETGGFKPTFAIGGNEVAVGEDKISDSTKLYVNTDPESTPPALTPMQLGAVPLIERPVPGNLAVQTAQGGIAGSGIAADDVATWARLYNDNLLINGDFTNPINQRGQKSYAVGANVYTIDRWHSNVGATVEITDNGVSVTTVPGKQWCGIAQFVEVQPVPGQSYTFSVECGSASGDGWYIDIHQYKVSTGTAIRGKSTNGTVWRSGLISATLDIPDGEITTATALRFFICNSTTAESTINLTNAKLELGDRFTGFYPTDPATELAKCQRYYERSSPWQGFNCVKANILLGLPFKVVKRTAPTITILSSNGIGKVTHFWDGAEVSVGNIASTIYGIDYMDLNGAVAGEPYHYGYIADAEIY